MLLSMKGNMPELRLRRNKSPYQYRPITRLKLKGRPRQEEQEEVEERTTMPKSATKTSDRPERTTDPTPSHPQGSHLPISILIQPPEPEQEQQLKTANEQQQKQQETRKQQTQGTVEKMKYLRVPKRMTGKKKEKGNLRRKTNKKPQENC